MKNRQAILLYVVAAGFASSACASNGKAGDKDGISATTGDWAATLTPRNSSNVRGTAGVQSAVVAAGVKISISGATPGASHPWHVHTGTCANSGGIVGSANSYPVLTVDTDGKASATATIGTSLSEGTAYSVNVHRSAADMGTIIACGELKN
jgi:hypothetical protein